MHVLARCSWLANFSSGFPAVEHLASTRPSHGCELSTFFFSSHVLPFLSLCFLFSLSGFVSVIFMRNLINCSMSSKRTQLLRTRIVTVVALSVLVGTASKYTYSNQTWTYTGLCGICYVLLQIFSTEMFFLQGGF